jgi:hypothetical protein
MTWAEGQMKRVGPGIGPIGTHLFQVFKTVSQKMRSEVVGALPLRDVRGPELNRSPPVLARLAEWIGQLVADGIIRKSKDGQTDESKYELAGPETEERPPRNRKLMHARVEQDKHYARAGERKGSRAAS